MTQSGQPGAPPPEGSQQPPQGAPPPPPPTQSATPPPPSSWQTTPQAASPQGASGDPSAGGGLPSWTANITSQAPVAGPSGHYYADVPNRIIAFIIDYVIFLVVFFVIGIVTLSVLGQNIGLVQFQTTGSVLVQTLLGYALIGAYFIYTWVAMRGTAGMKVLGMQIGHQSDGRTITYQQAAIRFALIFGPGFLASLLSAFALQLGLIASLVSLVWFIALLVTTAQSPTKQGLHDRYAQTMVVKAARAVS